MVLVVRGLLKENPLFLETPIPYAARTFEEDEVVAAVSSTLDFWLTLGQEGDSMERSLAEYLGVRRSLLVNSGSSANLLAISSLTSHKLPSERRLMKGDEVITCAAGFRQPLHQLFKMVPYRYSLIIILRLQMLTPHYWRKLTILKKQKQSCSLMHLEIHSICPQSSPFCKRHDLWLIEDNCDASGRSIQ